MLEQLRPPTDNLYKFLALAGLAVFLLGFYMTVFSETEIEKFRTMADDADNKRYPHIRRYEDAVEKIDDAIQAGTVDAKTAHTRKMALYEKMKTATEKYNKEIEESNAAAHKIYVELKARYEVLGMLMWGGGGVGVIGFWLWYVRLQRPLDEIMKYDLADRRAKANKPA